MHLQALASIFALTGAASAFVNASPWIFVSTSSFLETPNANQIQSTSEAVKFTSDFLSSCPTDRYLIVSQSGLTSGDLRQRNGCALPHLCQAVKNSRIKAKYVVSEVIGEMKDFGLMKLVKSSCAKKGKTATFDDLHLPSLSYEDKNSVLASNDEILAKHIETVSESDSYTILFLSSPTEPLYEADFIEPVRMELKKRNQDTSTQGQDNDTDWNKLPLFEKYQFFTPGIFMAIITAIVLLSILGVGLSALGSLEVSYGAFEKEVGPAAQKKNL